MKNRRMSWKKNWNEHCFSRTKSLWVHIDVRHTPTLGKKIMKKNSFLGVQQSQKLWKGFQPMQRIIYIEVNNKVEWESLYQYHSYDCFISMPVVLVTPISIIRIWPKMVLVHIQKPFCPIQKLEAYVQLFDCLIH